MSKSESKIDDLAVISARIKVGAFMTVTSGLVLLTLSSTLGDEVIRSIILGVLTIVFVVAGGLLGLVSMHQVSQTHLPETTEEDLADISLSSPTISARSQTRPRGFLGLFSLTQDASEEEANSGEYRRTA